MEHTKTPWTIADFHVDRGNIQIGSPEDYIGEVYANCEEHRTNAEFIVRACNAHDVLVETGRTLAILALQSIRYTHNMDFRDAVDNHLIALKLAEGV